MTTPKLFARVAELSDETALARAMSQMGCEVRVGTTWLRIGLARGLVALLTDTGADVSYSNLNLIEEVRWGASASAVDEVGCGDGDCDGDCGAVSPVEVTQAALDAVLGRPPR